MKLIPALLAVAVVAGSAGVYAYAQQRSAPPPGLSARNQRSSSSAIG